MSLPKNQVKPSTRHHVVDHRFAAILEDDFGIETSVILDALIGSPQKQAIFICEWASHTGDPAYALRCWARRRGRGAYRVPSVAQGGGRSNTRGTGRGSGPARPGGIAPRRSCVLDPAFVRANLQRMWG